MVERISERRLSAMEQKKEQLKRWKIEQDQLKKIMRETFDCPAGIEALKWMAREAGFGKNKVAANAVTGGVDPQAVTLLAMNEAFYLKIRALLPVSLLTKVEYENHE